jgi:hypothetical protein
VRLLQAGIAAALLLVALASQAPAATGKWDHAANIKDAASRLAKLHRREGSPGVVKFLEACYRTHLLASAYSQGLEACMAQDYMHSQVLALIYSRLPPQDREKLKAPSPEFIAQGMGQRFGAVFSQYKVPVKEAEDFKRLVDKHGFPEFMRAVFPKANEGNSDAPAGDKKN